MCRWLLPLWVVCLSAQQFDYSFYHRNTWHFPPARIQFRAERVVTSAEGRIFVATPEGLHTLEWNQFILVEGLPREKVLDLTRLESGEVAVQFSSAAYSTDGRNHKPIQTMPKPLPRSGQFVWDDFSIELQPGHSLKVHRKSDRKPLIEINQLATGSISSWYPAGKGQAFFLVGDTWALVDSRNETFELLQFILPNRIEDLFLDPQTSKLYLALGPKGIAIASLDPISGSWDISQETSAIQLLEGALIVTQARGASVLKPTPIPWGPGTRINLSPKHPTLMLSPLPGLELEELQQVLITAKGTHYALPRKDLPQVRQGVRWKDVPYPPDEKKPLPVRWLAQAEDGTLWGAGKHGLVQVVDPDSSAPRLARATDEFATAYVSEFRKDSDNKLWMLGEGWIATYEAGSWRKKTVPPCVLSPRFRSLAIRNSNEYWIAYRNGAPVTRVVLGPKPTCTHYGKDQGNPNEETNHLEFDRDGWLWMLGSVSTIVLTQPDHLDKAIVLPHSLYLPSGSAHWHGFTEEGADVNLLVGKTLTRIRRSFVQGLASLQPRISLQPDSPTSFRFGSSSVTSPELSYSIAWRWLSSEGKPISEFTPLRVIYDDTRPRNATAIELLTPAGTQVLEYPIHSPIRWVLASLAIVFLLMLLGYRYRWHIQLWWPSPRIRQSVERTLFLQLRSADAADREKKIQQMPASVRPALQAMLEQFERISEGEDERTRSGLILDEKYLLEHVIAKGGFATVYLAQDIETGSTVAVKLFQQPAREGSWLAKRLALEIEAMEKIDHPGVVRLIHHGTTYDGRPFLVMNYIQGITLRQLLRRGPVRPSRGIRLLTQVATALAAVHAKGILHRDIKPENIVLRNPGSPNETAMLIDFGVATVYDDILDGGQSTFFAGSLDYSAPEQIAGLKLEASDVYSLGVLAFEIMTGNRFKQTIGPSAGADVIEAALVQSGCYGVSSLANLIAEATAVEHSRRLPTAQAFLDRLES